jgi:osmotically-inducible protein OsmY
MKTQRILLAALFCGALMTYAQEPPAKQDNPKTNKRDRNSSEATADQQKTNKADREMAAQVRKSIMADKSLATSAHNVKIASQDGVVTLTGQVNSEDEKKAIVAKAVEVAGSADKVKDDITVKP